VGNGGIEDHEPIRKKGSLKVHKGCTEASLIH
jgi:hypothetical protein